MTAKEAKKICDKCPTRVLTKNPIPVFPSFYTCGEFGVKVEGVSCGCIINLKVFFVDLLECPQGKW